MRRLVIPALLAVLLPSRATAQAARGNDNERLTAVYGIHYGVPMRFSIALGAAYDLDERRSQGVLGLIEQGQHGHEISAGYFKLIGRYGSGFSVRGAVLRTDGEPWKANPQTTYVGGELHWMLIFGVGGRVGLFRRASHLTPGEHDTLGTMGVSIGM